MRTALRTLEGLLLDGGGRTARRNAWQAVLEDRSRARARAEAEQLLTAMPTTVATTHTVAAAPRPVAAAPQPAPPAGVSAV